MLCCLCLKQKKRRESLKERPSVIKPPALDLENSKNKFIDINFNQANAPLSNLAEALNVTPKPIIKDSKFSFGGSNLKVPSSNISISNFAGKESQIGVNPSINLNININVYNKQESPNKADAKPQHLSFIDTIKTGNFNKSSTKQLSLIKPSKPKENSPMKNYKSKSSNGLEASHNLIGINSNRDNSSVIGQISKGRCKSELIDNKNIRREDIIQGFTLKESGEYMINTDFAIPSVKLTKTNFLNLVQLKVVDPLHPNRKSQSNISLGKSNSALLSNKNLDGSYLLSTPNKQQIGMMKVNQKFSKNSILSYADLDKRELMKISTSLNMIEVNLHLRIRETINYHMANNPILLIGTDKFACGDYLNDLIVMRTISNINNILKSELRTSGKHKWPLIKFGNLFVPKLVIFREDSPEHELTDQIMEIPAILFNYTNTKRQSINEVNYRVINELIEQVDALNFHTPIFLMDGSLDPSTIYFIIKFSIDSVTSK